MDLSDVAAYGARDGKAELAFEDGSRLLFVPYVDGGEIRGLASVLFYRGGVLEAVAVERGETAKGFWCRGAVTQAELAAHCEAAVRVERQVYRLYRQKAIDEETWHTRFRDFWRITIKCRKTLAVLQEGSMQELTERPEGV